VKQDIEAAYKRVHAECAGIDSKFGKVKKVFLNKIMLMFTLRLLFNIHVQGGTVLHPPLIHRKIS
jgi:hypothetical protein